MRRVLTALAALGAVLVLAVPAQAGGPPFQPGPKHGDQFTSTSANPNTGEVQIFALNARQQRAWAPVRDYLAVTWGRCADRMADACAAADVQFLDLSSHRFSGWAFLDLVHMTDHGYRQTAELIEEALR